MLTIREIVAAGVTYTGVPAIPLDSTSYQSSASRFELSGGALGFYGNAKIDALSFANDFNVTVLLSADPAATYSGGQQAGFETHAASVAAGIVPAPDYTIDCLTIGMLEDVNHVVQSVSGYAGLTGHGVVGQDYAIVEGGLEDATFDEVDVAFKGTVTARGTLAALSPALQLPTASFDVVGRDLDTETERTVIIRNTASGVSSYQLLIVTFNP